MNQPAPPPPPATVPHPPPGPVPPASAVPGDGPRAVIGVDPGARWTAACLRVRDYPVTGWTLGPIDVHGHLQPAALDDVDDWEAHRRYFARIGTALDQLVDQAIARFGSVRVAIETPFTPMGFRPGTPQQRFNRLPLHEWVVPGRVTAGVVFAYPDARLVAPDKLGRRPASEYPFQLRGTPPREWGPCEARRHERDHERAAYDVAGVAAGMP